MGLGLIPVYFRVIPTDSEMYTLYTFVVYFLVRSPIWVKILSKGQNFKENDHFILNDFFKLGSNLKLVSPLFLSVLNHSGFLFLWYSSIFHGVTTHADFHAFLESAKLTSVSVHSQNLARTILWTLTICQLVAYCSAEKSL